MDRSPKNREIEHICGNPDKIIERGDAIKNLGTMMKDSASTLEEIKNQGVADGSQKGKAIEKLKDSIGDATGTLRQAGELYEPVGPVISKYGDVLLVEKPKINQAVDDCEEKWTIFQNLPGDENGNMTPEAGGGFLGVGGYEADSPEAKQKAEQNQAKKAAYDDWLKSAEAFDDGYDTWSEAFDDAVNGIEDKMAGKIKDSFWGDLASFLEIAVLIIGVVALIVGGPLMVAIALVAGAILVAVTIAAVMNGERSWSDVALAALSIIPVGKVTSITKLANLGAGSTKTILKTVTGVTALKGAGKQLTKLVTGKQLFNKAGLVAIFRNHGTAAGFRQLLTGSRTGYTSFLRGQRKLHEGLAYAGTRYLPSVGRLARIDQIATFIGTTGRNITYLNYAGFEIPKIPSIPYIKYS